MLGGLAFLAGTDPFWKGAFRLLRLVVAKGEGGRGMDGELGVLKKTNEKTRECLELRGNCQGSRANRAERH